MNAYQTFSERVDQLEALYKKANTKVEACGDNVHVIKHLRDRDIVFNLLTLNKKLKEQFEENKEAV